MKPKEEKEMLERIAEQVHKAYCAYYLKRNKTSYWTHGNYNLLNEETKEADRVTARVVIKEYRFEALKRLSVEKIGFLIFKEISGLSEELAREDWTAKHYQCTSKRKATETAQAIHSLIKKEVL